jgi:hypothetical protein
VYTALVGTPREVLGSHRNHCDYRGKIPAEFGKAALVIPSGFLLQDDAGMRAAARSHHPIPATRRSNTPAISGSSAPPKSPFDFAVGSAIGSVGSSTGAAVGVEVADGVDVAVGAVVAGDAARPGASVAAAAGGFTTSPGAAGVTLFNAAEGDELPATFVATTVKVYATPLVKPGTVAEVTEPSVVVKGVSVVEESPSSGVTA